VIVALMTIKNYGDGDCNAAAAADDDDDND